MRYRCARRTTDLTPSWMATAAHGAGLTPGKTRQPSPMTHQPDLGHDLIHLTQLRAASPGFPPRDYGSESDAVTEGRPSPVFVPVRIIPVHRHPRVIRMTIYPSRRDLNRAPDLEYTARGDETRESRRYPPGPTNIRIEVHAKQLAIFLSMILQAPDSRTRIEDPFPMRRYVPRVVRQVHCGIDPLLDSSSRRNPG